MRTLDRFEAQGLGATGTAREAAEDGPQFYTIEHGDYVTRVAHLSYTYGLNGLPMPEGRPFAVNLIDTAQMVADATAARKEADLVVVSVHAGQEYQLAPTTEQVAVSTALAESGQVDLYVGHHAHIPQAITKLDGGPDDTGMWTVYGLGNMLSNQSSECCVAATSNGLMMLAEVTSEVDSTTHVTGLSWRALTVDRKAGHKLYDLSALAAQGEAHGKLSAAEIKARYDRVVAAVGTEAPRRPRCP